MSLILGIGISIAGSVSSNFGVNVQKYSQMKNGDLPKEERKPYLQQWLWWGGLIFVIVGALADFGSLSFAAQAVVMPVGSLTLVANVFFAHFWLGEDLGMTDIVGTVFIVLGASVLAVAYGALGDGDTEEIAFYDAKDLQNLYHRWIVMGYGFSVLALLFTFLAVLRRCEYLVHNNLTKTPAYTDHLAKLHPLSYAAVSGLFGSFSVTFGKSIGELLAATADSDHGNQFLEPLFYVFLVCMVGAILLQTHYLAHGLEYFDALFIIPVFQCFFIINSILGGALYWEEMNDFNLTQWIVFPLGVLITLWGVYLMSSRNMQVDEEDEEPLTTEDVVAKDPTSPPSTSTRKPRRSVVQRLMPFHDIIHNPILKTVDEEGDSTGRTGFQGVGMFMPVVIDSSTGGIHGKGVGLFNARIHFNEQLLRRENNSEAKTEKKAEKVRRATIGSCDSPRNNTTSESKFGIRRASTGEPFKPTGEPFKPPCVCLNRRVSV